MTDLDGYLLKCVLEGLENNQKADDLTEHCSCSIGLSQSHIITTTEGNK